MGNYDNLRTKWGELVQQGKAGCNFDFERLISGKFCVHISDAGGESMSCYSSVELTGFFDNAIDALGYYRFAEIPRILDWDTNTHKEPFPDVADAYLLKYEAAKRAKIDHLIGLIDRALISEAVSSPELFLICEEFNATFSSTNPEVQILAWGSLYETLSSDYFAEAFDEDIEEETDEDEKPSTVLKGLLDSGGFDEYDDAHLTLARDFFEKHMSA